MQKSKFEKSHDFRNTVQFKVLRNISDKPNDFSQKGFSDLVFKNRKFGGTSMFRSKRYLLYQASILVDKDLNLIERYLKHPSKEPDYRGSRTHRDFLIGLNEIIEGLRTDELAKVFESSLAGSIDTELSGEFGEVDHKHIKHLMKRIDR